ncbi:(S)-coclaurine N-methyltransferase-like [Iris pallida]|uniref:(S)-coclaurine N-methyltransferase-like n=1 Tax=Iris pallida TaxID=29817 RepID=A0AAX6EAS6_IRIPA|nr:(S)-coclaurine N-methyltransferase-like [Iris pallida]
MVMDLEAFIMNYFSNNLMKLYPVSLCKNSSIFKFQNSEGYDTTCLAHVLLDGIVRAHLYLKKRVFEFFVIILVCIWFVRMNFLLQVDCKNCSRCIQAYPHLCVHLGPPQTLVFLFFSHLLLSKFLYIVLLGTFRRKVV